MDTIKSTCKAGTVAVVVVLMVAIVIKAIIFRFEEHSSSRK